MDLGLAGKQALVTGATKGIGRAIAETLLAEGASVAICARTADDVEAAVADLSKAGTVVGSVADVGDADALKAWVATSAEALGGIDIYVHNTSAGPGGDTKAWKRSFDIDLMALVHGVEAATEHLVASDAGALVSISTTAASEHFGPGANNYSALKAAVENWTLGQAQTLGAQGVRCNVVSPGPIFVEGGSWDFIKNNMEDFYKATLRVHPGRQMGSAADVANAVAFLASPAAGHVNGANLTVDGGFLKRIDF
ncbi:MAG: SDR family oxidoreductase [Acidimicrobiia bacterium]|nr:SDR family oxidoreductase [Acidimicrobiia bacterium]